MADGKLDLSNIEVVLLLDFSGTMSIRDQGGLTRLEAVKEVAQALAGELEKFDDDGITVVKFASKVKVYDGVTSQKVTDIFLENRAMGNTNTKEALSQMIDKFLAKRQSRGDSKPACIICFTDGKPDDPVGVASVIVNATKRIKDRSELGILFIQVGNDQEATEYLDKLNSHLTEAGASHDIVAVTRLEEVEDISTAELVEMAFTE